MTVRADMLNGHAICHGGFIFTLADSAFAFACNSYNLNTVASGCAIDFLAPAREGDVLTARARERRAGGPHGRLRRRGRQPARRDGRAVSRQELPDQGHDRRAGRASTVRRTRCQSRRRGRRRARADRDARAATSSRRCSSSGCAGRSRTPTSTCRTIGKAFDAKGVHPRDLKTLADLAQVSVHDQGRPARQLSVRHVRGAARADRAHPRVVGNDRQADGRRLHAQGHRHVGDGDGALDPRGGRTRGRHHPRRVRLRPLHRRPRRALRRGEARLHGDSDVGRQTEKQVQLIHDFKPTSSW